MPVILHNRAGGAKYLFVPIGPRVFYYGNARDAEGIASQSNAEHSTRLDYFQYFLHDVALEPGRFIELWLHKIGVFLSSTVTGQNLDFQKFIDGFPSVLALVPMNFSVLLVLALVGWLLLWRERETRFLAFLLIACFFSFLFAVVITYVESRFKAPVIVWMLPAAGFALDQIFSALRRKRLKTMLLKYSKHFLAIFVLLLAIQFAANDLPRDVIVSDLPHSATAAGLRYDDSLELVGWQVRTQYSAEHTIEPYHPWVVSLYWRLLHPTATNYSFTLKYYIDGEEVTEYDRPIGYTVYPRDNTSEWQSGAIYVEHIGLTWRGYTGPFEQTGQIHLDVYPEREAHRLIWPRDATGSPTDRPVLARPAILLAPGRNKLATNGEVSFGDVLFLLGHELPAAAAPNESVPVRSAWRTGDRQIEAAYSIGIYAFLNGKFLTNIDSAPKNGTLQTFSLLPGYHFDDAKVLTLPATVGNYDIFVGVYNLDSGMRLPVSGRDDNLFHIGNISVE